MQAEKLWLVFPCDVKHHTNEEILQAYVSTESFWMGGEGGGLLTWNTTRYGALPKRNTAFLVLDARARAKLLRDYERNKLLLHKTYKCVAVHDEGLDSNVIFFV